MRKVFVELGRFIWTQKKFWLVPIIFVLLLMLILLLISVKSGALAPFIYPLF